MAQTAKECLSFLAEAGEAVEELSVIVDREKTLEADEQRLGHALDAEKKLLEDAVGKGDPGAAHLCSDHIFGAALRGVKGNHRERPGVEYQRGD